MTLYYAATKLRQQSYDVLLSKHILFSRESVKMVTGCLSMSLQGESQGEMH